MTQWQPGASLETLRSRAAMLGKIRNFFRQRGVLEVETPTLAKTTALDPHLQSIEVPGVIFGDAAPWYLQTSPEFHMKRLLAAGSGAIFQIGKAYRRDERSRSHNPEFTMLEWYQPGFDEHQLMDEVAALLTLLMPTAPPPRRCTYRQVFSEHLGIDPHTSTIDVLLDIIGQHLELAPANYTRDDLLGLLLAEVVEPALAGNCFVYDFPASMASLSVTETDDHGQLVARRFELFMDGLEIANGYRELGDATEQRRRFLADIQRRQENNLPAPPVDERLLAALDAGFPQCAGVALGVDRLLMKLLGSNDIENVISFSLERS